MKLALLLTAFLAALETAIPLWRSSAPTSSAPVFSLPMMDEAMKNPGKFQRSIDVYNADRGGELKLPGPDGTSLTLFYFEWDQVEAGPLMDIAGHAPEECNVAAGFTLKSRDPQRVFESPGHSPWQFDTTTFVDPRGLKVHVFKTAWIQGFGSWDIRQGENRMARFTRSFTRGRGAARVIEVGITGAKDESQAWQIFQSEVLGKIDWTQ
jgi:hypothetical protein